jgi:hypothetical protein
MGLGFAISPLVFSTIDADDYLLTFVNGSFFYNFLTKIHESFTLGPFIAANMVRYGHPSFVELRSGLIFSFRSTDIDYARDSIFAIDVFFVELGYKYNKTDKHGVYAHVGFDLVAMLKLFSSSKQREYEDYQKENEPTW